MKCFSTWIKKKVLFPSCSFLIMSTDERTLCEGLRSWTALYNNHCYYYLTMASSNKELFPLLYFTRSELQFEGNFKPQYTYISSSSGVLGGGERNENKPPPAPNIQEQTKIEPLWYNHSLWDNEMPTHSCKKTRPNPFLKIPFFFPFMRC